MKRIDRIHESGYRGPLPLFWVDFYKGSALFLNGIEGDTYNHKEYRNDFIFFLTVNGFA